MMSEKPIKATNVTLTVMGQTFKVEDFNFEKPFPVPRKPKGFWYWIMSIGKRRTYSGRVTITCKILREEGKPE